MVSPTSPTSPTSATSTPSPDANDRVSRSSGADRPAANADASTVDSSDRNDTLRLAVRTADATGLATPVPATTGITGITGTTSAAGTQGTADSASAATGRSLPARNTGPSQAPILPVYPTRLPAAQTLMYDLRRGAFSGTGELRWTHDGQHYQARLEGKIAGFQILTWSSEGLIDSAGIAPVRYTDRRRGSAEQAANFLRDQGLVRYSGPAVEFALPRGGQDRLSWMLQIAAIADAQPQAIGIDQKLSIWVSGARGDADVWVFRSLGPQSLTLGDRTISTVKLVREPREPYDTRVEVWLDPARDHLPVQARLGSGRGDDTLELTLKP